MTERVEQRNCIKLCIKLEHSSVETIQIQKATAMGNWWLAASSWQCACSCIMSCAEVFGEISNHPGNSAPYSSDLAPCYFWLFPQLKSPLKGKRFQTIDEIHVWGPKVPILKGTEASLSYVQCFLYLLQKHFYFSYSMAGYLLDRPGVFWPGFQSWPSKVSVIIPVL